MLATAKHYPGRGEVELIAGTEYTINRKPADRVEAEDFLAFKKAIDAGVAYVMSEHIAVPSVAGGSDLPASVEKRLATDWLRGKLGFTGNPDDRRHVVRKGRPAVRRGRSLRPGRRSRPRRRPQAGRSRRPRSAAWSRR